MVTDRKFINVFKITTIHHHQHFMVLIYIQRIVLLFPYSSRLIDLPEWRSDHYLSSTNQLKI